MSICYTAQGEEWQVPLRWRGFVTRAINQLPEYPTFHFPHLGAGL